MRATASEHQLQVTIVDYLGWALPVDERVVGVSNNPRSKASGGREKARGMSKGFPDIVILGTVSGLLEVKTPKGRLTPEQVGWAHWCELVGFRYHVVRSLEDVDAVMSAWGIKLKAAKLI